VLKLENLGNFAGPLLFKPADAPEYVPGFIAVVATSIAAAVLSIVYRFLCVWENRRRDKTGTLEGYEHAYEDDMTDRKVSSTPFPLCAVADLHENPQFRYTL